MDGEYGNDFITVTDDDDNEFELEHLDTAEINGEVYMAFLPVDIEEDDDEFGIVILKVTYEDNEEILSTVDDENVLNEVYAHFIKRLSDDEED